MAKYLDFRNGLFIEAGANNGLAQSNTYWFERFRGWRGILIEAVPDVAAKCRQNRPRARVVNAALVASEDTKTITVTTGNLMGYVTGHFADKEQEARHRRFAVEYQNLPGLNEVQVPARTLAGILEEYNLGRIDLFSLDVEGYELEVFKGMNVERHRPRHLCVETTRPEVICAALNGYYETIAQLSEHDFLFRARDA
ncbi:MAG TPA: FkbM family methyltransferase [Rhizomicrobium sp.]|nr:FkbM family methyltransferase [Rhizomicrobium sp.]